MPINPIVLMYTRIKNFYIPITISNNQNISTPAPFQQLITINPSLIGSNLFSSDLGNIRFYADYAFTQPLYAWVESGNSNTATTTNIWVKLPNGIPANSSIIIYMRLENVSTEYDGVYMGEAPQLSSTYAQYDNGSNVFNNYWNFAGTSLSSSWQEPQTTGVTINNGVSFAPGNNIGYIETTAKYPINEITETNFNVSAIGYGGIGLGVDINGNPYTSNFWLNVGSSIGYLYNGIVADTRSGTNTGSVSILNGSHTTTNPFNTLGNFIGSIIATSSEFYIYQNYSTLVGYTTTNIPPQGNYYILIGGGGNGVVFSINWVRQRAYPPNGTMPNISVGII
ncbi:MAG: hypothetical protein QW778_05495 [Candidatus Micrarchaeaceae archaeon]